MITKFKITRVPKTAVIEISSVAIVLDQEYPISSQTDMTIAISGTGVPYDDFGYKLGNEDSSWSREINAVINANVETNTPEITPLDLLVTTNGTLDILPSIVTNSSTDKIRIVEINPKQGNLIINGSNVVDGQIIFISNLISSVFRSQIDVNTKML